MKNMEERRSAKVTPENSLWQCEQDERSIARRILENPPEVTPRLSELKIRDHSLADYSCEVIMNRIREFEDSLDNDHEIAIKLASFGQSITMSVTDVSYANPSTLVFHGYVDDQRATLIQHMSQLNFLLLSVQKSDPKKPPIRIGFAAPSED